MCDAIAILQPRSQLERALRIPALSAGWRGSLEALLAQERSGGATIGNAGLTQASGPPPAWPGFRPLRVSRKVRESSSVISLVLEPADAPPLTPALPGQFIAVRLRPSPDAPALTHSYSLSGEPNAERYRVSVKREVHVMLPSRKREPHNRRPMSSSRRPPAQRQLKNRLYRGEIVHRPRLPKKLELYDD
jgi:hypothetical protein